MNCTQHQAKIESPDELYVESNRKTRAPDALYAASNRTLMRPMRCTQNQTEH